MRTLNIRTTRRNRAQLRLPRSQRNPLPAKPAAPAIPVESSEPVVAPESLQGDTLMLYLREIGQVKLLTPQEEIKLARRIRRGDKAARELMITSNLRLVVKMARDYEGLGLPLLDLINEGNIGLMKAVERFRPGKGAKLSSYASWWIKQSIRRALTNTSKTIRLPVHVVDKMSNMRKAEVRLRETLDREPSDEEVAEELGLDARRVRLYRSASRAPVPLDAPLGPGETTTVSEHVADTNTVVPSDRLASHLDHELMHEVLASLDARESRILAMRFGLDDGEPKSLEVVGQEIGVTRERIRQIQEQALQKMRVKFEKRDQPSLALAE